MTSITTTLPRSGYRSEVESLLEQIRRQVEELRRLKTVGVRAAALGDRKRELEEARRRLAALVGRRRSSSAAE